MSGSFSSSSSIDIFREEEGEGLGHLCIGCISLYGEVTDVLDAAPSYYDIYNESELRARPYIVDIESGINTAILSVYHGWNDGINDLINTTQIGYERHGLPGGAAGTLIALANAIIKPLVGTLSSLTWICRGFYAGANNKTLEEKGEEASVVNTLGVNSSDTISDHLKPDECKQILLEYDRIKGQRLPTEHQS